MMRLFAHLVWLAGIASHVHAQMLVGFGRTPYDPVCAEACRRSFSALMLDCSAMNHEGGSHSHASMTEPDCYAESSAFLSSVAWCFRTKCEEQGEHVSKLERYWEDGITGSSAVPPKWTYSEALARVDPKPPSREVDSTDMHLNVTSTVNAETYLSQINVLSNVQEMGFLESEYAIIIIVIAIGMPVLVTALGFLPFAHFITDKIKPYLIWPSAVGTFHVRHLPYLLGNAPTVGQSLYIAIIIILNVVLCSVNYKSTLPNAWYSDSWQEISAYVMYRTGAFAFMLSPVLVLFSSRNNLLMWLSNWSHSTFMLLHRWIARLFMIYVVIHSIIGLQIYSHYSQTAWWIWGAAATVATVILTLASGLYVRKSNYEIFLITHIVLSVLILVGSWYHLILWYASMDMKIPKTSGYEVWLYIAFCFWFFDRAARLGRIIRNGLQRSVVTDLGNGYVRVDVAGVRWGQEPGQHVYLHFPTLDKLRPWESHPFSVVQTPLISKYGMTSEAVNKEGSVTVRQVTTPVTRSAAGVTFFIKKSSGITRHLQASSDLLTFLDGPYPNSHPKEVLRCDRVLLIAGGIGITGLLPWAHNHKNSKLFWSVKESARCLLDSIDLSTLFDVEVNVGERFRVQEIIAREVDSGWERIGVLVSGPGGLCDEVRASVSAFGRAGKAVFELEVDAYSW